MEIINDQNPITNIFLQSKSSENELIYQTSSDYLSSDEELNFNKNKINDVNKKFIDYTEPLQYEKTIKKRIIITRQNILLIKGKM